MQTASRIKRNAFQKVDLPPDTHRCLGFKRNRSAVTADFAVDDITYLRPAVSFGPTGSIPDFDVHSKLFPVMEIGQDYLAFLTEFPVQPHSGISLRYFCGPDAARSIPFEGRVISCLPVKDRSPYRFCVYVLFNPLLQKRKYPLAGIKSQVPYFTGMLQFAA